MQIFFLFLQENMLWVLIRSTSSRHEGATYNEYWEHVIMEK